MVGVSLLFLTGMGFSSSAIALLYLAVLGTGAQSVTADRDVRRSNKGSDKYKKVRQ